MVLLVTAATPGFRIDIPTWLLEFATFINLKLRMVLLVMVLPVTGPPLALIPINDMELVITQRLPAVIGACDALPPIKLSLITLLLEFELVLGLKSKQTIALVEVVKAVS